MTSPLQRAADAVCEARCSPDRPDPGKGLDEFIARAVILAIREPGLAVQCAGDDEIPDITGDTTSYAFLAWQAMIDAALSD